MRHDFRFAAVAILLCAPIPVSAGIIVGNTSDILVGNQPTSSTISVAQGFTMDGTSEVLSTIAAAVTPGAHLFLYTEDSSVHHYPDTLITALTDTGTQTAGGDEIYVASTSETLAANQSYAVVMTGNGYTWGETMQGATNVLGVMDTDYSVNEGAGWFGIGSGERLLMQVNAAAVPEPSSIVMAVLALMIGGVVEFYRCRRGPLRVA